MSSGMLEIGVANPDRMTAGTRNRNNHGCHRKNVISEAWPKSKNAGRTVKVKKPANSR